MDKVTFDLPAITKELEDYMTKKRLWHTIGVMHTAAALAMAHGVSIEKAQIAGLLHDCAKCIAPKKTIKLCKEHHIEMTEFEMENPFLLHGKLGAWIAAEKYGVTDPEVLSAITWHTTGKENMTSLEKIIFIADYIEPSRDKAPGLSKVRPLAFQDLDRCTYQILKDTLEYLDTSSECIDQTTEKAYIYYKNLIQKEDNI